jgi:glucose/arabinose dehydrogenase
VRAGFLRAARLLGLGLLLLVAGLIVWAALEPDALRQRLVQALAPTYQDPAAGTGWAPRFEGADARRRQVRIDLQQLATGLEQPTDVQFPPGNDDYAVVLEKTGAARWLKLADGTHGLLLRLQVATSVEEGLLGLAFHPQFAQNGRFFLNYVTSVANKDKSVIGEWRLSGGSDLAHAKAEPVRVLMEVAQPYANHNGGQLAFGPDGYLYIGWGDGGFRDDPQGNGQNPRTLLGSMLRIDVDHEDPGKAYRVPADNPFVGKDGYRPETWAYGVRNPWRFSFDPGGRLVVADVGQDTWEELDLVQPGDNLGWNIEEGFSCFKANPACGRKDLVEPVYSYGHDEGQSITGGYVYTGSRIAALRGLYVFGDFASGRLFALALPSDRNVRVQQPIALGKWPMLPSTFGRDARGELYVASFARGAIYRLGPHATSADARNPARAK